VANIINAVTNAVADSNVVVSVQNGVLHIGGLPSSPGVTDYMDLSNLPSSQNITNSSDITYVPVATNTVVGSRSTVTNTTYKAQLTSAVVRQQFLYTTNFVDPSHPEWLNVTNIALVEGYYVASGSGTPGLNGLVLNFTNGNSLGNFPLLADGSNYADDNGGNYFIGRDSSFIPGPTYDWYITDSNLTAVLYFSTNGTVWYSNAGTNPPPTVATIASYMTTNIVVNIGPISTNSVLFNQIFLCPSNGTNDTKAVQNAFSIAGSCIKPWPMETYYISNILVTNNIIVEGAGARFRAINSTNTIQGWNVMFDTCVSNINQSFYDTVFDGGKMSNYITVATIPILIVHPAQAPSQIGYSAGSGVGLLFNTGGGGTVSHCTFEGFDNSGIVERNVYNANAQTHINGSVINCQAYNNFIGFNISDTVNQNVGTNYGYYRDGGKKDGAEYSIMADCYAEGNGIGFYLSAANVNMSACVGVNNFVGLGCGGAQNNNHGLISGITLNHNTYPYSFGGASMGVNITGGIGLANANPGIIANGSRAAFFNFLGNVSIILTNNVNNKASSIFLSYVSSTPDANMTNIIKVLNTNCLATFYAGLTSFASDGTSKYGIGSITNATGTGAGTVSYQLSQTALTQIFTTNVVGLTSFVCTWSIAFADTNYSVVAGGGGLPSSKTTTNCVITMPIATGEIDCTGTHQ
jgi:hypothetical protein